MGYAGKVVEREQARVLRASGTRLVDIASQLGVSKGTVSTWVRDVPCPPSDIRRGPRRPSSLHLDRLAKEVEAREWALDLVARWTADAALAAGVALYAGEGAKTGDCVGFVNVDPRMITFFMSWLRRFFVVDERGLRVRLYLHQGLDLDAATAYWSAITGVAPSQFTAPYRAEADQTRRLSKHLFGCCTVRYHSKDTLRKILALCDALLTFPCPSGIAQLAERLTVNQNVVGSIPTPGAL